jgi:hypothetical protein
MSARGKPIATGVESIGSEGTSAAHGRLAELKSDFRCQRDKNYRLRDFDTLNEFDEDAVREVDRIQYIQDAISCLEEIGSACP